MKNLMSHSDYEDSIDLPSVSDIEFRINSRKHRQFLKQPLDKWMFIPCDEDGNVLKEPLKRDYNNVDINNSYFKQYQQAKERCLFDGFEMYKGNPYNYHKSRTFTKDYIEEKLTIEKIIHWELQLTQTAIKNLGL